MFLFSQENQRPVGTQTLHPLPALRYLGRTLFGAYIPHGGRRGFSQTEDTGNHGDLHPRETVRRNRTIAERGLFSGILVRLGLWASHKKNMGLVYILIYMPKTRSNRSKRNEKRVKKMRGGGGRRKNIKLIRIIM